MHAARDAPRRRFGLPVRDDDYTFWDLEKESVVDPESFLSMGRATPFDNFRVYGECVKTVYDGKTVYEKDGFSDIQIL